MASKDGAVTLRGRFSPGTTVRLVKVRDESVLRSEGGKTVDEQQVDKDGAVQFTKDVEVGARYFIVGYNDGAFVEVRARGNKADEADDSVLAQAPVGRDRQRLSDGTFVDEIPEAEDPGFGGVGPAPSQQQAGDAIQRSSTPRGYAHPHDPGESAPYPPQSEVDDGAVQRSDTPEGAATPIAHDAPLSQDDVKDGTLQRSDTPRGVATPIPAGDAVEAQRQREAADTKASVGEPVKAAAAPVDQARGRKPAAKSKPKPKAKPAAKKAAAKPAAGSNSNS